jgi:hypothetical protein
MHEVRSFTLQSSGMFLCNTSVLATIGSDFIKLMNTNKTSMFSYINTTLPNACTKINLLYD